MAKWSNWVRFDRKTVNSVVPQTPGIYRIRLINGWVFKIESQPGKEVVWQGFKRITNEKWKKQILTTSTRTLKNRKVTYSNLIYAGKSVDQDIRKRLLQHLNRKGNIGLATLLKHKISMYVSWIQASGPNKAELNFYKKYVSATGGHCFPGDCCSNECNVANGNCTVAKFKKKDRNYTIC